MNFLKKQNFFRPLIRAGIPDSISYQLYYEYVRKGQTGLMYNGVIPEIAIG